jgi:hypothetical protein
MEALMIDVKFSQLFLLKSTYQLLNDSYTEVVVALGEAVYETKQTDVKMSLLMSMHEV